MITDKLISRLILFFTFFILVISYAYSITHPEGYNDSAIFQYIGWRMSHGAQLYADTWDHKGPVIFIVNALGYLITPESKLGTNTLIYLIVGGSLFTFYEACRTQLTSIYAASAVLCLLLFELGVIQQPQLNCTENTALIFITSALWIFLASIKSNLPPSRTTLISLGLLAGCAFWVKGNYIDIGFLLLTYWTLDAYFKRNLRDLRRNTIWFSTGFILLSSSVFFIYFISYNNIKDILDASFLYNMHEYNRIDLNEAISELKKFFIHIISYEGALILLILSWLLARKQESSSFHCWIKSNMLLLSMFSWLIFANAMCCIKGRFYLHYLLITYPALFFCSFLALKGFLRKTRYANAVVTFILFLLVIPALWGGWETIKRGRQFHENTRKQVEILRNLNKNNSPIATYGGIATTRLLVDSNTLDPQKYCINMFVSNNKITELRRKEIETDFLTTLQMSSIRLFVSEKPKEKIFTNNKAIREELNQWQQVDSTPTTENERLYYYINKNK